MRRFGGLSSTAADLKLEVLFLPALSDQEFNPARHRAATSQTLLRQTTCGRKKNQEILYASSGALEEIKRIHICRMERDEGRGEELHGG